MTLINHKALRKFILKRAEKLRYHQFTRVSKQALQLCEAALTLYVDKQIKALPSKGKTIKF